MKGKKLFSKWLMLLTPFVALGGIVTTVAVNAHNKANQVAADTIEDLSGYTWVGNSSITFTSATEYSLSFTNGGNSYSTIKCVSNSSGVHVYYDSVEAYGYFNWNTKWQSDSYKTIVITGGTDATNASLISWLQSNGTLTGGSGGEDVAVTGVTLNADTHDMEVGDKYQLTPTISPDNATNTNVTWSSSNESVVTVSSSGLVTAVAAGSATVTVTTNDQTKTATCAFTVTEGSSPSSSDDGLYTTIILTDTRGWNFRTLWLDGFTYASGYDATQRNAFINAYYENDLSSSWSAEGSTKGYKYYDTGVNLCAGGTSGVYTYYLPAWITSCSVQVENSQHKRNVGTIDDLAEKCILKNNTWGDPVTSGSAGSGLGKTIGIEVKQTSECNSGAYVTISDDAVYSTAVTLNKYYLSSSSTLQSAAQETNHLYYLPSLGNKTAIDGYATDNKWYSGTTYAGAASEYDGSSIITSTDAINVVAKYEVGSNDSSIEIRFTRPSDWGDNTVCIHTWNDGGSTTTFPGYSMTYLKDNSYGQAIWIWSPSFDEPLYGNIKFNNNNNGMESDTLAAPSASKAYWYDNGWQNGEITNNTLVVYLYDYDNVYDGSVDIYAWRDGTELANGTMPGVAMTQLDDIATNGLIYKAVIDDHYNRVIFSNDGANATGELTPTDNYCYVLSNSIESGNSWWNNINYVFAHNFAQHTMLMDGTVSTDDNSVTQYCSARYTAAKTHLNAIMGSEYGEYVLNELNNNFSAAMARLSAWATANGESLNNDGTFSASNSLFVSSISAITSDNTVIVMMLVFTSLLAVGGYLVFRKKFA